MMLDAIFEVNPTGETYKPNCTRNGTTCLKSRYFTFNAVSHKPTPKLAKNAIIINRGRKIKFIEGTVPYQIISKNMRPSEIKKSTRLVITEAAGMIILGK